MVVIGLCSSGVFASVTLPAGQAFHSTTLQESAPLQVTGGQLPQGAVVPALIRPAEATYTVAFSGRPGSPASHEGKDYVHNNQNVRQVFVQAAADGVIAYVRTGCPQSSMFSRNTRLREAGAGWGNHVVIYHGNYIYTRYAHLAPDSTNMLPGDQVKAGMVIGEMGNTGRSELRHLHFELGYKRSPFDTTRPSQSFDLVFDPVSFYDAGEGTARISVSAANMRKGPSTGFAVITTLTRGTALHILDEVDNWYKVQVVRTGAVGYVFGELVEISAAIDYSSNVGTKGAASAIIVPDKERDVDQAIINSLAIFDSGRYNIHRDNNLGASRDLVRAIRVLNEIVYNRNYNGDAKSRYFIGKLYLLQGNKSAGERWLEQSRQLRSNNEFSWNEKWGQHANDLLWSSRNPPTAGKPAASAAASPEAARKTENIGGSTSDSRGYSISARGRQQLMNIVLYARRNHRGASRGYCFNAVWGYMTGSGYGNLNHWWDLPRMQSGEARHLAEYLNARPANLREAGLQRLDTMLTPRITNPHDPRIPDGAVIVVAAGSTGTAHPTAGDVVVKAGNRFINDGPNMYYGTRQSWRGRILGVYIPE